MDNRKIMSSLKIFKTCYVIVVSILDDLVRNPRNLLPLFLNPKQLKGMARGLRQWSRLSSHRKKLAISSDPFDRLELEVIEKLAGRPGMGGGEDYLDFKREYYCHLPTEQQNKVRIVLLRIIRAKVNWMPNILERAVHVSADLEMEEAEPDIRAMLAHPKYKDDCGSLIEALRFFELDIPKNLKFIFTEPIHTKSEEEFNQFIERFSALPPDQQTRVQQALLDLMRIPVSLGGHIFFVARAAHVYNRINPTQAMQEIQRMITDPSWKEFREGYFLHLLPSVDTRE